MAKNDYNKGDIFDRERAKLQKAAKRDSEKESAVKKASAKVAAVGKARPSDLGTGMAAGAAKDIIDRNKKIKEL